MADIPMGERPAAGNIVAAHAWRAVLNDDESRAYLQARLIVLSKLMFWSFVAFLTYVTVLYQTHLAEAPKNNAIIFVCSGVGLALLLVLWLGVLKRRTLTVRSLNYIDAIYSFGTGGLLAFGGYMASDFTPAPYACLLFTCLIVLTRAIMIPSSGRRTIAMSIVAFLPFALAVVVTAFVDSLYDDLSPVAASFSVILICAVVASLAATGSQTLYGLRQRANAAMQLGQYTLDEKIGEGGMGAVYRAHHMLLRRPTAVKLLRPDRVGADTLDRFEREVQHMSELTHPNTVAIYDFGRSHDGTFYYAMEYLDGIDLEHLVNEFGPQPGDRVIDILVQVCGAVHEAHEQDIVHRDIKPANIILCERGAMPDIAKVVDFGLVKKLSAHAAESGDQDDGSRAALTIDSQMILGTPGYLAPEAISSPQGINHLVDIYALGGVAYFLLTGKRVFEGSTVMAICVRHISDTPVPPSKVTSQPIPAALEEIILACLAKAPTDRPADAIELASRLRAVPRTGNWDDAKAREFWAEFRKRPVTRGVGGSPLTIEVNLGERAASSAKSAIPPTTV